MIGSLMMCVSVVVLLTGMLADRHGHYAKLHARACTSQSGRRRAAVPVRTVYRLVPAAGTTTLAKVQRWLHIAGGILFPAGVVVVLLKDGNPC